MSTNPGGNEGVTIIADVRCRSVLPDNPAPAASASANGGVRIIADFRDRAQPITGTGPVDTVLPVTANPETFSTGTIEVFDAEAGPARTGSAPATPKLDVLVRRIETALRTIHDALADIKSLRDKAG